MGGVPVSRPEQEKAASMRIKPFNLLAMAGSALILAAHADATDGGVCRSVDCPSGAIDEAEPCGTDTNGGCISNPPVFTIAECGDTFCGTLWIEDAVNDTDWFLINHGGGILSAKLFSQSPGTCFVVAGIDGCNFFPVGDVGCSEDGVSQSSAGNIDLPAGQYAVVVRLPHCLFDGIPADILCRNGCNKYRVEISCCPWDVEPNGGDGIVGITDFLQLLAQWGTDPGGPPDFDGDGNVGIVDFLELLAHWGPCP